MRCGRCCGGGVWRFHAIIWPTAVLKACAYSSHCLGLLLRHVWTAAARVLRWQSYDEQQNHPNEETLSGVVSDYGTQSKFSAVGQHKLCRLVYIVVRGYWVKVVVLGRTVSVPTEAIVI